MTPEREQKFRSVVMKRQPNLTVVLENVFDTHNIGAVLRSCDSVGIAEVFILYTEPGRQPKRIKIGKRTSAGARKWVNVHYYTSRTLCFHHIRQYYQHIYATHLSAEAESLHDLDFTQSVALVFGNEHIGITPETLKMVDGNFIIPQVGMVESLNISVACAVTLYEAYRQRMEAGFYNTNPLLDEMEQELLFEEYNRRHLAGEKGEHIKVRTAKVHEIN